MGHEAAGTVESTGEGVSGWERGDRDGRVRVEIFSAIYRSAGDRKPVRWLLEPEAYGDFDGRMAGLI